MTPPKLKTEDKIEALRHCVEHGVKTEAQDGLRKALKEKSNFLVAKAAEWAAEQLAYDLIPDLTAAFARFLDDPLTTDKTCAAKRAIARALYDLEYDNAAFFRHHLKYRQMEPVWGGSVDTAVEVRCTCAQGLVASGDPQAVLYLLELLHDVEYQARLGAVKAIELVQPFHAEIVLRHKILQGDAEPEVIAQSFSSLAKVAAEESLAFISDFLHSDDDVLRESAALALGESRLDEALDLLIEHSDDLIGIDPVMPAFYRAIALQRKEKAYDYLLDKVADAPADQAVPAIAALSVYNYNQDLRGKITTLCNQRRLKKLDAAVATYWKNE
jgi:HEAT repeat protein